jgi:uncharacterized sulfatase
MKLFNVVVVACLALVSSMARVRASEGRRPNLVVIMTDDQARWAMGAYGNTDVITPNMDRIAREGALFKNAFVNTPVCSPSRATFFTGRNGTQLAITDWINNGEARAGVGLPDGTLTWPMVLQKAGYRTGLVGKWHLGEQDKQHPTKFGFDHFMGFRNGGEVSMNPNLEVEGKKINIKGCTADIVADDALKFVEENKTRAFALCLFFREPHMPYAPVPEEDWAPFKGKDVKTPDVPPFVDTETNKERYRRYYASIHAADRNIGRMLAKLDELKLADNTIVIFTSDHGYNIGQHGIYTKGNASWVAGKVEGPKRPNMFEESIRVPLAIRWPGATKPGTTIEGMISNVDMFQSICAMLNVEPPDEGKREGYDFSPLLTGKQRDDGQTWSRTAVFGQYDLHNGGLAFMRMIRTDRYKLVRHHFCNGLDELYDLQSDPGEKKNLYWAPASKAMRDELQARLTAWQKSIGDPILKSAEYPTQPPGGDGR